ncbi:MAG: hypothetical protein QW568_01260 [Candidatus Anstonellaceae archaeon]
MKIAGLAAIFAAGFYLYAPELYLKNFFAALVIFAACLLAALSMGIFAYFYMNGVASKVTRIFILAMPILISVGVLAVTAYMLLAGKENFEEWIGELPGALFVSAIALAAAYAIAKSFENADAGTAFVGLEGKKVREGKI